MSDVVILRKRDDARGHRCPLPDAGNHQREVVMCWTCEKVWRSCLDQRPGRPDRWRWRHVRWLAWWYRLDAPEPPEEWP